MRWCRAALWAFLQRWLSYFVAGAVVLVAGMSGDLGSAWSVLQALCAWLVLPLFLASAEPATLLFPAVLLQAVAGAGLVWGARPLLWPTRWALAERALPIARRDSLRSDAGVVALVLLPLGLLEALGAQALVASHPVWLLPLRAVLALGTATAGSVLLGVALLQALRRYQWDRPRIGRRSRAALEATAQSRRRAEPASSLASQSYRLQVLQALIWLPLRRGPARRSGRLLVAGSALLCTPALAMLRWPHDGAWWLSAHALIGLLVVTRLNGLLIGELTPLFRAMAHLPLAQGGLRRAREVLAILPWLVSIALLLACLPHAAVRGGVVAAYVLVCFGSCAAEIRTAPVADAARKSSRWLFCLVVMLAFASEVMR